VCLGSKRLVILGIEKVGKQTSSHHRKSGLMSLVEKGDCIRPAGWKQGVWWPEKKGSHRTGKGEKRKSEHCRQGKGRTDPAGERRERSLNPGGGERVRASVAKVPSAGKGDEIDWGVVWGATSKGHLGPRKKGVCVLEGVPAKKCRRARKNRRKFTEL